MAAERMRVFVGATELESVSTQYIDNNDAVVNSAEIGINPSDDVSVGSTVAVKRADGSTTEFSGRVTSIREPNIWVLNVLTNGYELIDKTIQKTYEGVSPESIVQDVCDNFTDNLTFVATESSGVTIDYIADGYLIDVIKDMMKVLRWRLNINNVDEVRFQPEGSTDVGRVLTNGSNFVVEDWETTEDTIINSVKVKGGFENINTEETISGTGTEFTLSHKPSGSMRVLVSASEVSSENYTVRAEEKKVIFDSSQTDPTFQYSFNRPITVEDVNSASVTSRGGIKHEEIDAPFLLTRPDVRRFARAIVTEFGDLGVNVKGYIPELNYSVVANETVTVRDPLRGDKNARVVVKSITRDYDSGNTILSLGPRSFDFVDWQAKVQDRIKELKRRFSNDEDLTFIRGVKSKIKTALTHKGTKIYFNSPTNTLIANHTTLGYARTVNQEVDCSGNGNHGTWQGTGIDGSQYEANSESGGVFSTPVHMLSCGVFNGTDNQVTSSGVSETGCRCVVLYQKDVSNSKGLFTFASGKTIEIDFSGNVTATGFTNSSVETDGDFVYVEFDSDTLTNPIAGYDGSAFCDGKLDDILVFDTTLTAQDKTDIKNKTFYSNHSKYSNCKLWWAFDNPLAGDRSTSNVLQQTVTG